MEEVNQPKPKRKFNFYNFLFIILIIGLLIFMMWVVNFMKTNARDCLADPLAYIEEQDPDAVCSCFRPQLMNPPRTVYDVFEEFQANQSQSVQNNLSVYGRAER